MPPCHAPDPPIKGRHDPPKGIIYIYNTLAQNFQNFFEKCSTVPEEVLKGGNLDERDLKVINVLGMSVLTLDLTFGLGCVIITV